MKQAILTSALVLSSLAAAEAQTKPRWKLEWEHTKPQIYTHRNDVDRLENIWFFTYTITNATDEVIPILLDLMLYTETGKDLQNDVRKVDPDATKATLADPRKHEALKFGRFYSNVLIPQDVEYAIIAYHSKIGNRSPGIVAESIEEFKKGFPEDPQKPDVAGMWKKGDRLYLNSREMRQQRFIRPGQKLHGIAVFKNVDPRARILEMHVSGLWDVIRMDGYEPEDLKLHYENKVLKVSYDFKGDEFERERDVLVQTKREWVIKAIGPVAAKETMGTMVDTLLGRLKLEERWAGGTEKPEDVEKEKKFEQLTPLDMAICSRVIRLGSGKDFGYDVDKSVLENKAAVWRIHEWWVTNRTKLVFNEATGRFEIRDDILPGVQKD
jgi:hypothetical protein